MTLEKASEIFDALGFKVALVDKGVVKVHIVRSNGLRKSLDLHNIYFKKYEATPICGEHIYAWSGTLEYEDVVSRCYDCVPLIKLYRDVIEHNNEMLEGAGIRVRMV